MLDIETLNIIPENTIFGTGIVLDNPKGININNSNKELRWVAIKGYGYNDWCIYAHLSENNMTEVKRNGNKVYFESNIRKLVPCTDEVFKKYRM